MFFDDECLLIDGLGFVCPRARPVVRLLIFGSSICFHHAVRMSCKRLHFIIFVSLVQFMIMFMICVARSALGGWRRLLHHLRANARLPLRLVHSLLFLLLPLSVSPQPLVVRYQLLSPLVLPHVCCPRLRFASLCGPSSLVLTPPSLLTLPLVGLFLFPLLTCLLLFTQCSWPCCFLGLFS